MIDVAGDRPEALVIGAGPAGLAGALYLARFRRRVLVLDGGDSRAARIPRSHNVAGFAQGVPGEDLLTIMRRQVLDLGVEIRPARVQSLERQGEGLLVHTDREPLQASVVLLATGARDLEPPMPDAEGALDSGALRYCPVCDGYEAIGRSIGVLCDGPKGASEALYLRHFSERIAVFVLRADAIPAAERERLDEAGVTLHPQPVRTIRHVDGGIAIEHGDQRSRCEALYAALGMEVGSGLATRLGAEADDDGYLRCDRHQQTTVPGLYAAGDVARGLNQISVAIGEAAIAASAMHLRLRAPAR